MFSALAYTPDRVHLGKKLCFEKVLDFVFDLCAIITIESQRKSKSKAIQQHFDKTKGFIKNPICPYKSENVKNNIGQPIRKAVTEKSENDRYDCRYDS